jgi:hypothetical protein
MLVVGRRERGIGEGRAAKEGVVAGLVPGLVPANVEGGENVSFSLKHQSPV